MEPEEINEDKFLDEFMGENGRAAEWKALRESLSNRLKALRDERATTTLPDAIASLDKKIASIADQVAVLETEEIISEFIEGTVKSAIARGRDENS